MFKVKESLVWSVTCLSFVTTLSVSPSQAQSETAPSRTNSDPYQAIQLKQLEPITPPTAQNVTSVSQLSDVKPTDWAFTALQSLVERYGCIAGYPDRTYRGNQSTSRYEFAAGLNACLDKVNEIISAGLADKVSKEDLATLQKLQEEFATELATLRGRVDALDAKTAQLEAQQFSTTTKLNGEVIFSAIGVAIVAGVVISGIPSGGMLGELMIVSLYGFPIEALPIITMIGTLVDPPATMLNATGDNVVSMLIARILGGKGWMNKKT